MAELKKASRLLDFLLIFALVYVISQFGLKFFFPPKNTQQSTAAITLTPQSASIRTGNAILLTVKNNTEHPYVIPSHCPLPPVAVFAVRGTGSSALAPVKPAASPDSTCVAMKTITDGDQAILDLSPWKYAMFATIGTYEVRLPSNTSARFAITEPNAFIKLFRTFITKPFLNFLVLVASILPDHSLGAGIILLTLIVKLLLFIPTQHALEGQKKMQLLQPKLEAVRKQFKDDTKRAQEETMKLWKEHGVNPLQSCLPILVQFPVLIGLFYVIRDNVNLSLSQHLLYPVYSHLNWNFSTHFLGLDLTDPQVWIFPPLLVVMQFLQMKLSFMIADKKKEKQIEKAERDSAQEMQQRVMTYALPLMIGFFALKFPSAVSLYWGVSTLFAIGQQVIVNREHIKA